MSGKAQTVAIFNTNEDTIELLRHFLERAGFNTVAAHVPSIQRGDTDLLKFVEQHDPDAIVYDIPPPYKESWTFASLLRSTDAIKPRPIIFTTTNAELLRQSVGETGAYEIVQKPYDFEKIVRAVEETLKPQES
ncbi:MAG TPA: response regulator [Terriglobia bacterium]|nr:response regulator [Terriglobia bacterium]